MPVRIVIVGGPFYPYPPAPCGAVERVWHGMAMEFARAGHTVTIICRWHPSQPAQEMIAGVQCIRHMQFSRTGNIKWDLLQDLIYSLRVLRTLPVADVAIPHSFWLPWLLPRLRHRAGNVVAHVQRFPKGQIGLYLRTASITTVSQTIADAIVQQCPRASRLVRVIPNPIHTDVFLPPARPRAYGPNGTILYTGRVHPEKGVDLLVQAVTILRQEFPGLHLRIVGPTRVEQGGGGDSYLDRLRGLAGDYPIDFVPPVSDVAVLADVLRDADFYCYPSIAERGEASPVAPLEAMATGLAPVVSSLGQFRGYLVEGRNGLAFDQRGPDAIEALADQLRSLIVDPDRARMLGMAAVQTAQQFSYRRIAGLYLDLFTQLLEK